MQRFVGNDKEAREAHRSVPLLTHPFEITIRGAAKMRLFILASLHCMQFPFRLGLATIPLCTRTKISTARRNCLGRLRARNRCCPSGTPGRTVADQCMSKCRQALASVFIFNRSVRWLPQLSRCRFACHGLVQFIDI